MSKTKRFLREEENFKLEFGTRNNNWQSVELTEALKAALEDGDVEITDGMYLAEDDNTGKFEMAGEGDFPAYPILEEKKQYDNIAAGMFTVSVGSVPAFTKVFEGDPEKGDYLQVVDTDDGNALGVTEERDDAVARCLANYGGYIKITKLI